MYELKKYLTKTLVHAILLAAALTGSAAAQSDDSKKPARTEKTTVELANPQTVDARQSGVWTVGINPEKNVVRLPNSAADPLAVKVVENGAKRKAFQARAIVAPTGNGFQTALLSIPAGKRLIIENISAIARCPEGLRMEMNFYTYIDNNGDGVGDISDITFHRIALTDQGTFDGTSIFSANHDVLVFADEQIGTQHFGVAVQARLNGSTTGFTQAQFTFTGYLEDLPTAP
jgi:hypothetical protein